MGRGQGRFSRRASCESYPADRPEAQHLPGKIASRRMANVAIGVRTAGFQWDAENERAMGVLCIVRLPHGESDPVL